MDENDYKQWIETYGGWILIGIFSLIPVFRWFQLRSFADSYISYSVFFASFGKIVGLVGLVLYAINYGLKNININFSTKIQLYLNAAFLLPLLFL